MPGMCVAIAAAPLAYRGVVGEWPFAGTSQSARNGTRAALSGDRGIHVRESTRVEKPVAEVYDFWHRLENLRRLTAYLDQVTDLGDGRSHWVASGPGSIRVEWDAEIFNDVPNRIIAWRTLPGSDIVMAGAVNFATVRGGRSTQISVHLQYNPPAGRAGAFLAAVFGREPSQTIREELRQIKQTLEAGEIPRASPERI